MRLNIARDKLHKYASKEYATSNFLPYKYLWNDTTVLLADNSLMKVVKIHGIPFETSDDDDINIKQNGRNNLLKGMASGNFLLYFHTIRRRDRAFIGGEFDSKFCHNLNEEWKRKHSDTKTFVNEHYISIIRTEDKAGIAAAQYMLNNLKHKADNLSLENDLKESYNELDEMTDRVLTGFSNYNPEILGIVESDHGNFSELLAFLGMIANCGYRQKMRIQSGEISKYIPNTRLHFGKKMVEAITPEGEKFAGLISIKEYRSSTFAGILDGFLQLPFEFITTQSFLFTNRGTAITKMQLQQRRLVQSQDVAISQINEIDEALDSAMSGKFAFGSHHLSVLCIEESAKGLENALSMAVVTFSNVGITAIREKINLEPAYWAQLPGNSDFAARKGTINTLNLAGFASFHNYPSGKKHGNHWGDAVTILDTTSSTAYFFSFHVRDVGHTMIIGPTGAGKTVLMNFLCAQSQKFNCRMFFFDKDHGAEIFIRAIGGKYSVIDPATESGFNPCQLDDNPENRTFLSELIKIMVSINGEKISAHEMDRIEEAVDGNYKLPKKERRLANIAPFLGLEGPGSLAGRFKMWHSKGSHSKLFDNATDVIDFTKAKSFGFEMGRILKDKMSIGPALLYLFHRINQSLDGTPSMIVLDEAWALIDNDVFAPKIKDWLKVLRKLNCFVIFATQSVEDATKSSISDTLVQQTATQIYLPNLKATKEYKKIFGLSDREFQIVRTTDPMSRFFLVKQDNNGAVCRIDLSGMGDLIKILSGRVETVAILHDIIKKKGENPEDWMADFLNSA